MDESRASGSARRVWRAAALGLALAIGLACANGGEPEMVTLAQVEVEEPTPGSTSESAGEVEDIDPVDRGIGVVYFDRAMGAQGVGSGADTLAILRDTVREQIVARFILDRDSTSWSYSLQPRERLSSNALEFDYEVEGLPVAHVNGDGRWATVIHGFAADGSARTGWVRVKPGQAKVRLWPVLLRERTLFFADGVRPEFHGSVRGTPVHFPLAADAEVEGQLDYIMHPVQVQGDWMQVRVTSPSDMCASPAAVRQMLVWIRYLDERGRPRVWYHTRGC